MNTMLCRFLFVLGLGAVCGNVAFATDVSRESIAVLPLEVSKQVPLSAADLHDAVMKGLAFSGRTLTPVAETAAACNTPACSAELGTKAGAGYVVGGGVTRKGATFRIVVRLVRTNDATIVATEENECEVDDCSVSEIVRLSARELIRQTIGRAPNVPVATPASALPPAAPTFTAAEPVPSPPLEAPIDVAAPAPAPGEVSSLARLWPPVALGVGAVAIGTGLFWLAIDGGCGKEMCRKLYDTKTQGWVALGLGTISAAVGGIAIYRRSVGTTNVVVGPRSVALAGRF